MSVGQCPWIEFEPSTLQWCEAQVCGWIREPANTWSNLAYIIAGLWILIHYKTPNTKHIRLFGAYAVLLGFTSGFYHASGTFVAEVADFATMFLFSSYYFAANCARIWNWSYNKFRVFALGLLVSSVILLILFRKIGIELFALQFGGSIILELYIFAKRRPRAKYLGFFGNLTCFGLAYGIWWLDVLKIVCSPDTHWISGHAVWHLLNGVGIAFVAHFYSQFPMRGKAVS